ncbi:MAG: M61 family metallopeptidase [Acidobacteriales bacterium]|nr:M61 family metallopeptidase [Terriglobales bacterium]
MVNKTSRWRSICLAAAMLCCVAVNLTAQPAGTIRFKVSIKDTSLQRVRVTITLLPGAATRDLQLPVWNATYQIRDFAQCVNWVKATSPAGVPLHVQLVNKSQWRVSDAANGALVDYEIYAGEPGPFGAELNPQHAFFNLAELLMYPVDGRFSPMAVSFVDVPSGWKIATALAGAAQEFSAENYDRLVDAPVEIGTFREVQFDQSGGHYRVAVDADPSDYDINKIVTTLRPIVAAETWWMHDRPFETYLFIYHFPRNPSGGGMEHANSTAINVTAHTLAQRPEVLADVTSHEFFHLWNVKRIRPQSLEPVDYTKENYTRALWFSEGVTSTVADYARLHAGSMDAQGFLTEVAEQMQELESRPAHLTQSAEQSSLDAWLERYTYYNRPERSISYYNKGYLLGIALDLAMRDASGGKASLRDLFQWMNQHYAKDGKFFPDSEGVRLAAEAVTHKSFKDFFDKYVAGTDELPWQELLSSCGLSVSQRQVEVANPEFVAERNAQHELAVASVDEASQPYQAGLRKDDVLLALNGNDNAGMMRALEKMPPGEQVHLRVRGQSGGDREVTWKLAGMSQPRYEIKDLEHVTAAQKARRAAWLASLDEGTDRP